MLEAFLKSLKKLGYKEKYFGVIGNTFCFRYIKSYTHKVWTRTWITDSIRQFINRKNVELYNEYLIDLIENNKIDDSITNNNNYIMINELLPDLLKNTEEDKIKSEIIMKNIVDAKRRNIVFLDDGIYFKKKEGRL